MSSEKSQASENEQSSGGESSQNPDIANARTDWFLQYLVALVNGGGTRHGLTLAIEGSIVSGIMVSHREYFEEFARKYVEGLTAANPDEDWRDVGEIYASFGKDDSDDADDKIQPLPQYIHLRDARIFAPGGNPIPGNEGVLWRSRIAAVSGFTMGSLSVADN